MPGLVPAKEPHLGDQALLSVGRTRLTQGRNRHATAGLLRKWKPGWARPFQAIPRRQSLAQSAGATSCTEDSPIFRKKNEAQEGQKWKSIEKEWKEKSWKNHQAQALPAGLSLPREHRLWPRVSQWATVTTSRHWSANSLDNRNR